MLEGFRAFINRNANRTPTTLHELNQRLQEVRQCLDRDLHPKKRLECAVFGLLRGGIIEGGDVPAHVWTELRGLCDELGLDLTRPDRKQIGGAVDGMSPESVDKWEKRLTSLGA